MSLIQIHMKNENENTLSAIMGKEKGCEIEFNSDGPYWHICTPGESVELIFCNDDDFRFGMNALAIVKEQYDINIQAFCLMSNHIHIVASGTPEDLNGFFKKFRARLSRYISCQGRVCNIRDFRPKFFSIDNLNQLRNTIVYVNRNGYVVDSDVTPFSYKWGTGRLYYGGGAFTFEDTPVLAKDLTYRARRELFKCGDVILPNNYIVADGYIHPGSFCKIQQGQAFFRDAHHYFDLLTRNNEANMEIANVIGEHSYMTDQEIYRTVVMICRRDYKVSSPNALPQESKMVVAKQMHNLFNANNKQIGRILKLSDSVVNSMFPLKAPKS